MTLQSLDQCPGLLYLKHRLCSPLVSLRPKRISYPCISPRKFGEVCVWGGGGIVGPSTDSDIWVEASKQLGLCRIASDRMRRCLTANLYIFLTILIPLGKCIVLQHRSSYQQKIHLRSNSLRL